MAAKTLQTWFKILEEVAGYDLIKIDGLLKLNHQMFFIHVKMLEIKTQAEKMKKR